MKNNNIAIFLHIYYFNLCDEIIDYLKKLPFQHNLYVNIVEGSRNALNIKNNNILSDNNLTIDDVKKKILTYCPAATISIGPNQGMDIGGQLRTMSEWIKKEDKEEFIIFLHTKQEINWRKELLSILSPLKYSAIMQKFSNPKVGMIGVDKWNLNDRNSQYGTPIHFCDTYCERFGMKNMETKKFGFIGGTMFWVRSKIYEEFFKKNPPLEIAQELESYSTGGPIHALERILGYIILDADYTIEGI